VIGDDGEQVGVLSRFEACAWRGRWAGSGRDRAERRSAGVPHHGFRQVSSFEQQKKAQCRAKKKQKVVEIKELKFRPTTDDGDYEVKLRNLRRFLEKATRSRSTIRFKGREMAHTELGLAMAQRLEGDLGTKSRSNSGRARRSPDDHDGGAQEEVGRRKFSPQGEPERRPDAGFHPDPGNRINKPM
jgi:translation initiation factor IF-3